MKNQIICTAIFFSLFFGIQTVQAQLPINSSQTPTENTQGAPYEPETESVFGEDKAGEVEKIWFEMERMHFHLIDLEMEIASLKKEIKEIKGKGPVVTSIPRGQKWSHVIPEKNSKP